MMPSAEAKYSEYDPDRTCERCGNAIDQERQWNALLICRYPKYCSDICENRAACARYYLRRGKARRLARKALTAVRRRRKAKR